MFCRHFFLQIFTLLSMLAVLSTHLPILIKLLPMLIFQSRKCFFFPQYWTIISFPNLGKTASNIGVLFHLLSLEILVLTLDFQYIYQPCKDGFQYWTFNSFTNIGLSLPLPTLGMLFPMMDFHYIYQPWLIKIDFQPWNIIK